MPVLTDFVLGSMEDGVLTVSLQNPTAIGGMNLEFNQWKNFGSTSPIILKSCASGYGGGQSGIVVTDSGAGKFNVLLFAPEMSGRADGNYAYRISRVGSGVNTYISEGYRLVEP